MPPNAIDSLSQTKAIVIRNRRRLSVKTIEADITTLHRALGNEEQDDYTLVEAPLFLASSL